MKMLKRLSIALLAVIAVSLTALYVTGHGYILTSLKRTYLAGHVTANINDYEVFSTETVATLNPHTLAKHVDYNTASLPESFIEQQKSFGAAALLVIKDGHVLYEKYFNDYHERSKTNSFSMAKTVTTMLLGIAIEEGHIESLDQAIVDFLPEFENDPLGRKATIGQLSLMTSGYQWNEHYYSPFSPTVELLYGDNVAEFLLEGAFTAEPGTFWQYSSASTQLMGIFIERALKKAGAASSLSDYLSRKIWQPLNMNDDALWHTDENNTELVFCCLNTNARNYAKLGMLMLNNGAWQDQQVIPQIFSQAMITPGMQEHYGLSTWLGMHKSPAHYWFSGHLGQYIIVVPEHNMVVVRLGERRDPAKNHIEHSVPELIRHAIALTFPAPT